MGELKLQGATVVHGVEATRRLVAGLFKTKPSLLCGISDMDMLERLFPEFRFSSANPARLAAGVRSRFIYSSSNGPVYGRSDHLLLRESRCLPRARILKYVDLTVADDTVVKIDLVGGKVVARAVTSPTMAGRMRDIFEELWSGGGQ